MLSRRIRPPHRIDLAHTLAPLARGRGDPCVRIERDAVWRAVNTPEGPATQQLEASDDEIQVRAWGPAASWLLESAPRLVGCHDDDRGFHPVSPTVRRLRRRFAGMRIGAGGSVLEVLVPTVLEQKVAGRAAVRSYRRLVRLYGTPAPGPADFLRLPPDAALLADLPYWAWHPLGVERRRAEAIRRVASHARRLEEVDTPAELRQLLTALPGIGEWTAAIVARTALGDPDAVEVGDFHLPHTVAWALAGEERGDDRRMLELLEPYRGQRGRVVRLIEAARIFAPRRGPRLPLRPLSA